MTKTKRNRLFALIGLVFVAGCATSIPELQQGWRGATYDEVRRAWGDPSSTIQLPGEAVERVWIAETPSYTGSSVGVGFGIFGGGSDVGVGVGTGVSVPVGGPAPPHRCIRRLIFRDGIVVDQAWEGAPRYCSTFQRPA